MKITGPFYDDGAGNSEPRFTVQDTDHTVELTLHDSVGIPVHRATLRCFEARELAIALNAVLKVIE